MSFFEAKDLKMTFPERSVRAVDGVSLSLTPGRTLGLVGESGCGKSTLAKLLLLLVRPDEGSVLFKGRRVTGLPEKGLSDFRRKVRVIFQEPYLSLNPRFSVRQTLEEPLRIAGEGAGGLAARVDALLRSVELDPDTFAKRYPRELSGGECQRVAIARALSTGAEVIVCDEAVSALDALVRAQVLNLLLSIQEKTGVAYLFISHDLQVVRHMSDDILVMKDGRICESGPRERVFTQPEHPYTRQLLSACQYSRRGI